MSLFDEHGDVCRLLGKAEDVTSRQAAAEHFRQLAARHRRQAKSVLASARLDLTANQTLDAKAASRYLLRTLFDRTADACLRRMAAAVPESEAQRQFAALFSPEALGAAFSAGSFQFSLDHPVAAGKSGTLRARTVAEIAENPDTLHLEVFFQLQDRRERDLQAALLEGLIQRPGTAVLTADAATGRLPRLGPRGGAAAGGHHLPLPGGLVLSAAAPRPGNGRPCEGPSLWRPCWRDWKPPRPWS